MKNQKVLGLAIIVLASIIAREAWCYMGVPFFWEPIYKLPDSWGPTWWWFNRMTNVLGTPVLKHSIIRTMVITNYPNPVPLPPPPVTNEPTYVAAPYYEAGAVSGHVYQVGFANIYNYPHWMDDKSLGELSYYHWCSNENANGYGSYRISAIIPQGESGNPHGVLRVFSSSNSVTDAAYYGDTRPVLMTATQDDVPASRTQHVLVTNVNPAYQIPWVMEPTNIYGTTVYGKVLVGTNDQNVLFPQFVRIWVRDDVTLGQTGWYEWGGVNEEGEFERVLEQVYMVDVKAVGVSARPGLPVSREYRVIVPEGGVMCIALMLSLVVTRQKLQKV